MRYFKYFSFVKLKIVNAFVGDSSQNIDINTESAELV